MRKFGTSSTHHIHPAHYLQAILPTIFSSEAVFRLALWLLRVSCQLSFGNTKRAQRMQQPEPKTSDTAAALLGDCHPLLEQLGSTDGLVTLASAAGLLRVPQVTNFESLI